jgi:hypothetical protein
MEALCRNNQNHQTANARAGELRLASPAGVAGGLKTAVAELNRGGIERFTKISGEPVLSAK